MSDLQSDISKHDKVIVYFTASWCNPCKRISPVYKRFEDQFPNIKFIKIDSDSFPEATAAHGVTGLPTFIIFSKGKEIDRVTGSNEGRLEDLLKQLDEIAN